MFFYTAYGGLLTHEAAVVEGAGFSARVSSWVLGSTAGFAAAGGLVGGWFLDRYSVHPEEGERVEVTLRAQQEMSAASDFERGFMVMIDYGYTREEQLAGRHRGTLKAIRQHSVSANSYEAPGEQDITADVNFTVLAASDNKWSVLKGNSVIGTWSKETK